jgi:hypothetical protein
LRVDSTRLRVDRIDTHLRHTNPTALRVESTRDFLLCTSDRQQFEIFQDVIERNISHIKSLTQKKQNLCPVFDPTTRVEQIYQYAQYLPFSRYFQTLEINRSNGLLKTEPSNGECRACSSTSHFTPIQFETEST